MHLACTVSGHPARPDVIADRGVVRAGLPGQRRFHRTDLGDFPNPAALLRLASSVLIEAHGEWLAADKRYLSETTLALLNPSQRSDDQSVAVPAAITA